MPNETRTIHGCAHRETTSILSQSILQNVNSNRIIRTANAKRNQIYLKQLQITWHIFLVNCSFLIGNLINPKCHENHWTSLDQRTKKNSLLFSNPIQPIKKKKPIIENIFEKREEENKGNEPCGGLRLERGGTSERINRKRFGEMERSVMRTWPSGV